jgi:hypothetical protein
MSMRIAKIISLLGLLAMTLVLVYGFTLGDFASDGAKIMANPWGIVSLVDLYVGFAIFSCWIAFREKDLLPSLIWVVLMMTLGFWAGALYTFIALQSSSGDWRRFFFGKRSIQYR